MDIEFFSVISASAALIVAVITGLFAWRLQLKIRDEQVRTEIIELSKSIDAEQDLLSSMTSSAEDVKILSKENHRQAEISRRLATLVGIRSET